MSRRFRAYVFTLNNPPEGWDPEEIFAQDKSPTASGTVADAIRFLAGQYEIGDGGTRHFQGYICFRNPQGLSGARRLLGDVNPHLEPRKGSHIQALEYCHKVETREPGAGPVLLGDPPAQGERSDLDAISDAIKDGSTEADIAENYFGSYVRYSAGIRRAIALRTPKRSSGPVAHYYWGGTNTGKSFAAWNFHSDDIENCYAVPLSSGTSIWFDSYQPMKHKVVIFDDYYHSFKFHFLLQLLDGYPIQVPVKGGFIPFRAERVVFTSNIGLHEQYPNIPDQGALWRRFRHVMCVYDDKWVTCSLTNPLGLSFNQLNANHPGGD